jgi:hypothetical protein
VHAIVRAIPLAFLISCTGAGIASREQVLLAKFMSEHWNERLFSDSCAETEFDEALPIAVLPIAGSYRIRLFHVGLLEGAEVLADLERTASWEASGPATARPIDLDLRIHPSLERAPDDMLPGGSDARHYLLRFSQPLEYRGKVYQDLWVKRRRDASGAHFTARFGSEGMIESAHVRVICDDTG